MMQELPIHPFQYDPFQKRAVEAIERGSSLFVAAPTGSGKTVIADYAIERTLAERQRIIYTAPIKALSNQKFRDFTSRHGEKVGIMTGDVTINPTAPLVIMTTEIYRNWLLEDIERLSDYAWIIFDEVHYLDDPERGTVWEEAILFTPPHIKLLALSATIPNVAQLASWIRSVHQRPVEVIEETHRPVPLSVLFQCQNRIITDERELKQIGYAGHDNVRQMRQHRRHGKLHTVHPNRLGPLVQDLVKCERLPCIFFTFGRRRAEDLSWELSSILPIQESERIALRTLFDSLIERFQLQNERSVQALSHLIDRGIAYHHAGMLPTVKEVIERCFANRLLKLIVTTETFALGINMPARSVVLDTVKKRMGGGFELLRRRNFLQMSGRAGRRGMDDAGFVYVRINPTHVSYQEIQHLLHDNPEPVISKFNTTYATLLNLYRRHGRSLLEIFPSTFYAFQTSGKKRQEGLDLMQRKLALLESMGYIDAKDLTPKGEAGSWFYGYELILSELYVNQQLSDLKPHDLSVLMTAIVFEPKPNMNLTKIGRVSKHLSQLCHEPLKQIHKEEHRFSIRPYTKSPAFHMAGAVTGWMYNAPFSQLTKLCDVDEGEIVRYFRMAVQLLRQLSEIPSADAKLRASAQAAFSRMNRGIIDAEAQLRLG